MDVAVIGAGITGLTAALLLAESGRSVAVLEQEAVGSAHVAMTNGVRYHSIRRRYGKDAAKLVAEASRASMETIAAIIERYSIDCHFRRIPGYLYTEKRRYVAELKNEAAAAKEAGLDSSWTTDIPLPFDTRGGVLWPDQAQLHPSEYLAGLARHASAAGAMIFENALVTKAGEGVVETEHGRVLADAIFQTTNTMAAPTPTHTIAFSIEGEHPDGLFRDTADPHYDTRWQETDAGTLLIVGAEAPFESLVAYTRDRFGMSSISHRWSGPSQDLTFGTAGAMLIADQVLGIDNPWKALSAMQLRQ